MSKMTKAEAFAKIKNLLFGEDEKKFANAKLMDGTVVQWEGDLSEGVPVMVVGEDGNMMPAPDATHELEDGTKVTTVGGLVTSIEQKEKEVEVEIEAASEFEQMFATHLETFNSLVERLSTLESKVAAYESNFATISATIESTETNVNDKFSKVVELVNAISNEPIVPTPAPANITFKKTPKKGTALEMFKEYQENLKTN